MIYILMLFGFVALIKGADMLVEGASSLAKGFGISDLVVGLTIVSLGTSMPELIVTMMATIQGNAEVGVGNILGSNIANILLILGVTVLLVPINVQKTTVFSEIPFSIIAALLVGFVANTHIFSPQNDTLQIDRLEGGFIILFFVIFSIYILSLMIEDKVKVDTESSGIEIGHLPVWKSIIFIIAGCVLLFLGGKFVVDGAVGLAQFFKMSESFISLTIIAIGTSLPEFITSVVAAKKGNADVAIGNVIGSNILNILFILGLSSVILPIPIQNASNQDILVVVLSSVLLLILMAISRKSMLKRWHGVVLVSCYILYTCFLIWRG